MSDISNPQTVAAWTRLAAWAADPTWQPSAVALQRAQDAVIDTVACMVGGVGLPAQQAVRNAAAAWGEGPASLIGGGRASAPVAALVNGTAAHALDFDDHDADAGAPERRAGAGAAGRQRGDGRRCRPRAAGLHRRRRGHGSPGRDPQSGHYEIGWHSTLTMGCVAAAGAVAVLRGSTRSAR